MLSACCAAFNKQTKNPGTLVPLGYLYQNYQTNTLKYLIISPATDLSLGTVMQKAFSLVKMFIREGVVAEQSSKQDYREARQNSGSFSLESWQRKRTGVWMNRFLLCLKAE